jgi:serine/threonine protein kinase
MSSQIPEDDRTVIRPPTAGTSAAAPAAPFDANPADAAAEGEKTRLPNSGGAASSAGDSGNALPVGTYLAEFELTSVLGEGGFGIVYLAHDHSLQRRVALKEYMPAALAARTGATQVQVKSARHRDTFDAGLKSFVNEARLLAQFDHPSLVKVYRFWEANGTAYMVMPFYEGITLKDRLGTLGGPPDEDWLMALLAPLTEALAVIHAENCYHRDIAPDNVILLGASEKPLLLDFGAARRVIGDMTQALTVILKPGYAPVEQYAEAPNMKQGAWTDVYALAATMHFAIMGKTPPTSVGRLMGDSYVPLEQSAAGRYSEGFLRALDKALRVRPEDRTQTIEALRADLGLSSEATEPRQTLIGGLGSAGPSTRIGATSPRTDARPASTPLTGSSAGAAAAPAAPSRLPLWLGLGAVLVIGAALAGYLMLKPKANAPAASVAAPAAAPGPAPGPTAGPPPVVAAVPAPAPAPAPTPARFDVDEQFAKVLAAQSPGFAVEAASAKSKLGIGRDRLSFTVKSAREGYVSVMVLGPDASLTLLWPNTQSRNSHIKAGQTLTLPQPNWALDTVDPSGLEQFLVVVSEQPRDYSELSKEREAFFLKLPTGGQATELMAHWKRGTPMLLGSPVAECKGEGCDVYGAARFSVEVVQ